MSRLADKAAKVVLPAPGQTAPRTPPTGSKFSVAAHAIAVVAQQKAEAQLADAQRKLAEFEGASPTKLIDPRLIARSRWANRLEEEFATEEFEKLKAEIAEAGGNVQAIKVRRLKGAEVADGGQAEVLNRLTPPGGSGEAAEGEALNRLTPLYEVVFGHRRHQACLELGLPVLATITDLTDAELFVEMDRENRARKDLSPLEQGLSYKRALDAGLFPSARKLAESVGASNVLVSVAIKLASLPPEIVAAFPSSLDIQYRWAKPLADAYEKDPEGTLVRAREAAKKKATLSAAEVYELLIGAGQGEVEKSPVELKVAGRPIATIKWSRGAIDVKVARGTIDPAKAKAFHEGLEKLLRELS